ncbi:MAG TPA: alpha-glucuronidase family glycosyl hydrolase [Lacipirellulaceae bacterium]
MLKLGFIVTAIFAIQLPAYAREVGSQPIDLRGAQIVVPSELSGPEKKAVELLVEEIQARTRLRLNVDNAWPRNAAVPVIALGPVTSLENFVGRHAEEFAGEQQLPPEGYRIRTRTTDKRAPAVVIVGNNSRGVLYGVGHLLRSLAMSRDRLELPAPLDVTTAPVMTIRGHQLGYRPKTNSYDAWDLAQWEQYIRDLVVFGCNAIELIPPRSDDAADSPHFPRPQMEMMTGVSKLAADYDLDVWIWYPAMESSYRAPEAIDAAVEEWGQVLSKLPRVNALFVPSGDPGHVPPRELMPMLARQAEQLKRLHPNAQMWISMQSFTQPRFDEMLDILDSEPDWLTGIVHGPQTRISIKKLRDRLPSRYAIRGYPDITHSMRCEYPVPDWDLAYALTEGREVINPRPVDQTNIFRLYKDTTQGVITYSEGCNDDVNKMIWSRLCWDPDAKPIDTLREYSRYFIGERYTDDFAQGLLALERNWRGPLLTNQPVISTLQQFRAMAASAEPRTLRNWRFQQALYRATYDAYQHNRLIEETAQEKEAMKVLAGARQLGALKAIDGAEAILDRADSPAIADPLENRVNELAEALFQSIGMQLSVAKYQAIDVGRGANLDELNVPLNNRVWLKERFSELRALDSDAAIFRGIEEIFRWTDAGPGGFYDDLGNPSRQPHLVRDGNYHNDPGYLETPTIGFRSAPNWRRSWCTHVDGLYQTPVTMRYEDLDPHAHYKLRVVYAGDNLDVKVRLVAVRASEKAAGKEIEIHPFQSKPQPVAPIEFAVPREATSSGTLTLTWQSNPERGGPGHGCQIAEVWLIKAERN